MGRKGASERMEKHMIMFTGFLIALAILAIDFCATMRAKVG